MSVRVEIPEAIAASLRLPIQEIESRLRSELAIALYAQGILGFGKASELAGASRFAFADVISQRGIVRHYNDTELDQDREYAGGQ